MEYIWAPWRGAYIDSKKPEGCILCDKPREDNDPANLILFRGALNYIMLNAYPYNPGHVMVIPFRHVSTPEDLTPEELREHAEIVAHAVQALRGIYNATGFNTGMNIGRVAGAGIDAHIHSHIVPRWQGDSNFMPVIGDTKVIPQALAETYEKLKGAF
jgi:ATP adenylyltransferase